MRCEGPRVGFLLPRVRRSLIFAQKIRLLVWEFRCLSFLLCITFLDNLNEEYHLGLLKGYIYVSKFQIRYFADNDCSENSLVCALNSSNLPPVLVRAEEVDSMSAKVVMLG